MIKKILLLFVLLLGWVVSIQAQESTEHWLPPIPGEASNNVGVQNLNYSTTSDVDVNVEVYIGNSTTPDRTLTVPANGTAIETLTGTATGTRYFAVEYGTVRSDRGLRIVADQPIAVDYRFVDAGGAQADLIALKGNNARGTVFRLGGSPMGTTTATYITPSGNFGENDYSHFVSFVALEDNTVVNVSGVTEGAVIQGINGGAAVPVGHVETINLNAGEAFLMRQRYPLSDLANADTWNALIGALLESDKDVVVNVGNLHMSPSSTDYARDYGADQIAPVETMGTEFIFSRGEGFNIRELVTVVAHTNNTSVFLNGSESEVVTLEAGEYYIVNGGSDDNATTAYTDEDNLYIRTTNPATCYQLVDDASGGGQVGMFYVPPLICTAPRQAFIPNTNMINTRTYNTILMIVTRSEGELTINGAPLQDYLTAGTVTNYGTNDINGHYVNGSTNFVSYKLAGSALTGDILVESTRDLYCGLLGAAGFANYGGFYSGFAPEIFLSIEETACLPQVLDVGDDLFDGYRWFRNNVQIEGADGPTYAVTDGGDYYVIGDIGGCESVQS
ncbi:IgGFc-binding protein, partial [Galbibacter sp. EGI 63066]|uniref:IgGFc-binding protein n=1 Tax=Galbibacter sp. EGI 63066 TaxID=2993559 RepID=UPI002248C71E